MSTSKTLPHMSTSIQPGYKCAMFLDVDMCGNILDVDMCGNILDVDLCGNILDVDMCHM